VIALTPALAEDFAPTSRHMILEGFAASELSEISARHPKLGKGFRIAYAGGISDEYGVRNLILAFMLNRDPGMSLDLYGKGSLDSWVRAMCHEDERIRHHGLVSHRDLMQILSRTSLLVNPRPSGQEFVKYSFPSKLLEYLALGIPVVSTRLEGIPKDYLPFIELTEDDSILALADAISNVMVDLQRAALRSELGRRYVSTEKSTDAQGARIAAFLRVVD